MSNRYLANHDVIKYRGIDFVVPEGSFLRGYLANNIEYEPNVSGRLLSMLKDGSYFVDIGANIGFYSLMAASRVGKTGKVVAIEPDQRNAQCISQAARRNDFANIEVWPVAASKWLTVEALLLDSATNSGTRDLDRVEEEDYSLCVGIPVDHILQKMPKIDVIKVDVEAREHVVLMGCQETLNRFKPVVFSEFTPKAMAVVGGIEPRMYIDFMRCLGYAIRVLHPSKGEVETDGSYDCLLDILQEEDVRRFQYLDLMFVPNI